MRHWLRGWAWHRRHAICRVLEPLGLAEAFLVWLIVGVSIAGGTDTEFGTGAAEAVKLWATEVWHEAPSEMMWGKFIGREKNSVIQEKTELEGKPGDELSFSLTRKLTGEGVQDDEDMEGQEEPAAVYSDSVILHQLRNAVRLKGRMTERRLAFNLRQESKDHLRGWLAEAIDDDIYSKMTTSPAASRTVYPAGVTAVNGLTGANVITTTLMDQTVAKAKKAEPKVHPVRIAGRDWYVMIAHTDVAYDIEQNATWHAAQRDANIRGDENPIFTGRLGVWRGIVLHEHEKVPAATNGGAAGDIPWASSLFLGRQAGLIGYGMRPEAWEKEFDYGARIGFCIGAVWGMTKAVFQQVDHGTFEIRTARTNN